MIADAKIFNWELDMSEILQREVKGEGDLFFRQGDEANCAYIVQTGEVEIFLQDGDKELSLSKIKKNGLFGELALLDAAPRSASARATCLTTVIVVSRPKFEEKLAKADPFLKALLSMLSERLRITSAEAFSLVSPNFSDQTGMAVPAE
jgi:CRP/FNR family transcriptional regulator, cyclic AMP receptor protein